MLLGILWLIKQRVIYMEILDFMLTFKVIFLIDRNVYEHFYYWIREFFYYCVFEVVLCVFIVDVNYKWSTYISQVLDLNVYIKFASTYNLNLTDYS